MSEPKAPNGHPPARALDPAAEIEARTAELRKLWGKRAPMALRGAELLADELLLGRVNPIRRADVREREESDMRRAAEAGPPPDPAVWVRRSEVADDRARWLDDRERGIAAAENTRWAMLGDRKQSLGVRLYELRRRLGGVEVSELPGVADERWRSAPAPLRERWAHEAADLVQHHAAVHRGKLNERRIEHAQSIGAAEDALTRLCLLTDLLTDAAAVAKESAIPSVWSRFVAAWWERFSTRAVTAGELVPVAESAGVAFTGEGDRSKASQLGKWLQKYVVDEVIDGLKGVGHESDHQTKYALVRA
jgi:hypothetical protein